MVKVMIHVGSWIRHLGDETPETYELTTEGRLEETEEGISLSYDESELSGMKGTHTTILVGDKLVMLKRKGLNKMTLSFEKGKRLSSKYLTPYGEFDMEVLTNAIENSLDQSGRGKLVIHYHLVVKGLSKTENRLEIQVRD